MALSPIDRKPLVCVDEISEDTSVEPHRWLVRMKGQKEARTPAARSEDVRQAFGSHELKRHGDME